MGGRKMVVVTMIDASSIADDAVVADHVGDGPKAGCTRVTWSWVGKVDPRVQGFS
jgi:hypothetical protein